MAESHCSGPAGRAAELSVDYSQSLHYKVEVDWDRFVAQYCCVVAVTHLLVAELVVVLRVDQSQ